MIADDAAPAAERPKNVAPVASPGYSVGRRLAPEGAKDSAPGSFAPSGAGFNTDYNPGLAPEATFLGRSAANTPKLIFRYKIQTPERGLKPREYMLVENAV